MRNKYRRLAQLYEIKALKEYEKGWPEKYAPKKWKYTENRDVKSDSNDNS